MAGQSWDKLKNKNLWRGIVKKKCHGYNFAFQASTLNQRLPIRYVLRLIQWQNLKQRIVAVFFFPFIFASIAEITLHIHIKYDSIF